MSRLPDSWFSSAGSAVSEPQALCRVQGRGSYPTLEVVDAEGGGAAEGLGRMQLWSLLSLSALNAYLRQDPSPELALGPGGHRSPTARGFVSAPSPATQACPVADHTLCVCVAPPAPDVGRPASPPTCWISTSVRPHWDQSPRV